MKEQILITAATGKTGYPTTLEMLRSGYPVKILVRSRNQKALELENAGAELILGDISDQDTLNHAMNGVEKVYYCHPIAPGLPETTKKIIQAAKLNHIQAIVFMGAWLAEFDDQKSAYINNTRQSYTLFKQSGLNVIYLIPGFFAENIILSVEFAVQIGIMPLPFGNGKNPLVSINDLALCIAALLKNPAPYIGQKLRPTGPKSLTPREIAAAYTNITGHKVKYIDMPEKRFLKAAFSLGEKVGFDPYFISQLRHFNKEQQANKFDIGAPTKVVKDLTGKEPDDIETVIKRLMAFTHNEKRSPSGQLKAFKAFIRILRQKVPGVAALEELNK